LCRGGSGSKVNLAAGFPGTLEFEIGAYKRRPTQCLKYSASFSLFTLAVDSKLRACDLVQLRVRDVCHGQNMASRALILQQKTQRPVQFEKITEPTRDAVSAWIKKSALNSEDFLFPSRIQESPRTGVSEGLIQCG
jgi:hypothetical protein